MDSSVDCVKSRVNIEVYFDFIDVTSARMRPNSHNLEAHDSKKPQESDNATDLPNAFIASYTAQLIVSAIEITSIDDR
jgi:hypothetical protein